jgi:hypothetical protein
VPRASSPSQSGGPSTARNTPFDQRLCAHEDPGRDYRADGHGGFVPLAWTWPRTCC